MIGIGTKPDPLPLSKNRMIKTNFAARSTSLSNTNHSPTHLMAGSKLMPKLDEKPPHRIMNSTGFNYKQ